jgi:hypothetical protein
MAVSAVLADYGPAARLDEEIFGLIEEARAFLRAEIGRKGDSPYLCPAVETTRLTARLTDLAAWALGRKAFEQGEIDLDSYRREYGLQAAPVHLAPLAEVHRHHLSHALVLLLERSLGLYQRIKRLERNG